MVLLLVLLLLEVLSVNGQDVANIYQHASVAADVGTCSQVGTDILKRNGSAVDSYIATVICLGLFNPMSSGLGGGGVSLVYVRHEKRFYVYDYTGYASENADEHMFERNPLYYASKYTPLATTVPGQLKGLWTMHQNHGWLPWKDLFEPSIRLAEAGIRINSAMKSAIVFFGGKLRSLPNVDPSLKEFLMNANGLLKQEGDVLDYSILIKTLRDIQITNITNFYHGDMASKMVADLQRKGGILTENDFHEYQVKQRQVLQTDIQENLKLQTVGLPFSGPILTQIASIVSGFNFKQTNLENPEDAAMFFHYSMEAIKFALARREYIYDPDFAHDQEWVKEFHNFMSNSTIGEKLRKFIKPDSTHEASFYGNHWGQDHESGTTHTSVLAENGDAVSGTNTINFYFGALVKCNVTGIIYNNAMNDFADAHNLYAIPPSKWNKIAPRKRPSSSMTPTIVTNQNGDVTMVIGASGGPRIPLAVAEVIWKHLYTNMELGKATSKYRLYHTGLPDDVVYDYSNRPAPDDVIERLKQKGHLFKHKAAKSVVQAIRKWPNGVISSVSDTRKHGEASGY